MAAISETPEDIFTGSTDPGETLTENNGIDIISTEDENKASKKRKHESDKNDTELDDSNKQSKQFIEDDESDDGAFCPICLEPWTNSGEHRIASLKCGHFFGLSCIEKWLRTTGANDCPNCNEKATKKDIRPHYVARLKAVDTAGQDRAIQELERVRSEMRALELEHTTLKVTNALQREEIDKLRRRIKENHGSGELCKGEDEIDLALTGSSLSKLSTGSSSSYSRLLYVKRMDLMAKPDYEHRERYCRVMAYNETHGMLAVTQPSFTALAPGYGVRRVNMLDLRVEKYISLHREPIRDLAFNPLMQDQLLSVSQDKTARITNISSCAEIQRYQCGAEVWACCWDKDTPTTFFVGTKRSQMYLFDTRDSSGTVKGHARQRLEFPVVERRPIIGMTYVPASTNHPTFPCGGLLIQTLGSLWFFESLGTEVSSTSTDSQPQEIDPIVSTSFNVIRRFKPHKLPVEGLFWSLRFDLKTRLILVSTKPTPHARHVVCEPNRVRISASPVAALDQVSVQQSLQQSANTPRIEHAVTANIILDHRKGGSYTDRSFLRSAIFAKPGTDGKTMVVAYGRGSGQSDHKVIIQEVGTDKYIQEIPVAKPILDICLALLNQNHYVVVLCETEIAVYKWS